MPGRDGTGPAGLGSRTGRAMGFCNSNGTIRRGLDLGFQRGFCRSMFFNSTISSDDRDILQRQKEILENNLNTINKALSNFDKDK